MSPSSHWPGVDHLEYLGGPLREGPQPRVWKSIGRVDEVQGMIVRLAVSQKFDQCPALDINFGDEGSQVALRFTPKVQDLNHSGPFLEIAAGVPISSRNTWSIEMGDLFAWTDAATPPAPVANGRRHPTKILTRVVADFPLAGHHEIIRRSVHGDQLRRR